MTEQVDHEFVVVRAGSAHSLLRRFLALQGLGQAADAATSLVLVGVIATEIERGATPGALARAFLTAAVPLIVAGPLGGLLADCWDRRRALGLVTLVRAGLTAAAIAVPVTGDRLLGYVVVAALLTAARVTYTVRSAAVPHVVAGPRLVAGNSLSVIVAVISGVAGGALGALGAVTLPIVALGIAALAHLVAAVGWVTFRRDLGGGRTTANVSTITGRGDARLLIATAPIRSAFAATSCHRALLGVAFATFVLFAEQQARIPAAGYATAVAAMGVGGFLGALTAPVVGASFSRARLMAVAYALAAVALGAASVSKRTAVVAVAVATATFAFQNLRVVVDASIQRFATDSARGRVFSIYDLGYNLAFLAGGGAGIVAQSRLAADRVLLGVAAAYAAGALVTRFPRPRRTTSVGSVGIPSTRVLSSPCVRAMDAEGTIHRQLRRTRCAWNDVSRRSDEAITCRRRCSLRTTRRRGDRRLGKCLRPPIRPAHRPAIGPARRRVLRPARRPVLRPARRPAVRGPDD